MGGTRNWEKGLVGGGRCWGARAVGPSWEPRGRACAARGLAVVAAWGKAAAPHVFLRASGELWFNPTRGHPRGLLPGHAAWDSAALSILYGAPPLHKSWGVPWVSQTQRVPPRPCVSALLVSPLGFSPCSRQRLWAPPASGAPAALPQRG